MTETPAAPEPGSPAATGPVILLVDDDPTLGQVVAACLDFEGAEVRTAHTLAAARLELHPSLDHVVLDRRLPDGDGLELLDDLRERCPDVPVIVFTAYDDPSETDLPHLAKADIAELVERLGLEPERHGAAEVAAPEPIEVLEAQAIDATRPVVQLVAGDAEGL